ncbi:hypothetical protein EON76_04235 [bacterium]|nr:MAG: hypothetical protein EON76_04235 [bacterium]
MSEIPSRYLVRAAIPNAENPDLYILDQAGRIPSVATTEKGLSVEQILQKIGGMTVGVSLSIDRQTDRKNVQSYDGIINVADVIAKPIDPNAAKLFDGYSWGEGYL